MRNSFWELITLANGAQLCSLSEIALVLDYVKHYLHTSSLHQEDQRADTCARIHDTVKKHMASLFQVGRVMERQAGSGFNELARPLAATLAQCFTGLSPIMVDGALPRPEQFQLQRLPGTWKFWLLKAFLHATEQ